MTNKSYIDENGDALELDEAWFQQAKRGRPPLPAAEKKRRVNLMLDPDLVEKLRASGNMSARANKIMRDALGI